MKQKVLVIVGPTASGKSDLAVKLAKKFNGGVISADSRQVYKGLNVGTGKITKKEMQEIPHYLLDVADPKKQFSVSDYKTLATDFVRYIERKGKLPIIVGGTGFYIDVITGAANFPNVPPNPELRRKLSNLNLDELMEMLKKKDSVHGKKVDQHNKQRIIRALEIVEALGKVPRLKASNPSYEFVYVGLKPDKEELEKRIHERLVKRLPAMIREAKKLHEQGLSYERMHELGLEYRYLAMYLKGEMGKEEMGEKLNIAIRQYARRQMTWFKRNKKIRWFRPGENKEIEIYLDSQELWPS